MIALRIAKRRLIKIMTRCAAAVRRVPVSAGIHGVAAALHAANGDYAEAVAALCLAIASLRHH